MFLKHSGTSEVQNQNIQKEKMFLYCSYWTCWELILSTLLSIWHSWNVLHLCMKWFIRTVWVFYVIVPDLSFKNSKNIQQAVDQRSITPICRKSRDFLLSPPFPTTPLDFCHGLSGQSGQCPGKLWKMYRECKGGLDNVLGVLMDKVDRPDNDQGNSGNVQGVFLAYPFSRYCNPLPLTCRSCSSDFVIILCWP